MMRKSAHRGSEPGSCMSESLLPTTALCLAVPPSPAQAKVEWEQRQVRIRLGSCGEIPSCCTEALWRHRVPVRPLRSLISAVPVQRGGDRTGKGICAWGLSDLRGASCTRCLTPTPASKVQASRTDGSEGVRVVSRFLTATVSTPLHQTREDSDSEAESLYSSARDSTTFTDWESLHWSFADCLLCHSMRSCLSTSVRSCRFAQQEDGVRLGDLKCAALRVVLCLPSRTHGKHGGL